MVGRVVDTLPYSPVLWWVMGSLLAVMLMDDTPCKGGPGKSSCQVQKQRNQEQPGTMAQQRKDTTRWPNHLQVNPYIKKILLT